MNGDYSLIQHTKGLSEPFTISLNVPAYTSETLVHVQEIPGDALYAAHIELTIESGGSFTYIPLILGGISTIQFTASLKKGAQLVCAGAYALSGNQTCTIKTVQRHDESESSSSLIFNGVVAQAARIQYEGKIVIHKQASQCVASQENKTLLLNSTARATSLPSLEIENNAVHCKHGSAVGPLQPDQLWALQSRGISYSQAQNILISSLYFQTLAGAPEQIRALYVTRMVKKLLGQL